MINPCLEIEACNYSDGRALEIHGDHKTIWLSTQILHTEFSPYDVTKRGQMIARSVFKIENYGFNPIRINNGTDDWFKTVDVCFRGPWCQVFVFQDRHRGPM